MEEGEGLAEGPGWNSWKPSVPKILELWALRERVRRVVRSRRGPGQEPGLSIGAILGSMGSRESQILGQGSIHEHNILQVESIDFPSSPSQSNFHLLFEQQPSFQLRLVNSPFCGQASLTVWLPRAPHPTDVFTPTSDLNQKS